MFNKLAASLAALAVLHFIDPASLMNALVAGSLTDALAAFGASHVA